MAISTNGTVIARLAGGLYNQTLSNATYNEVVAVVKSAADINTLANDLYARDFASKTDLAVATSLVSNLGLSSVTGLNNWVAAQLTAAGAAGKGAKIVSLLNDLSNLTSDAAYGSYATAFNAKTDAALALSQKAGSAGGDFSAAATLAAAEAAAAAAAAAAKAAADSEAAAAAKAAADAAAAKVIADAEAAANAPKTFSLTSGVDSFSGGAGNDTFDAYDLNQVANTLSSTDVLSGGDGVDALNVYAPSAHSNLTPTLSGIENIMVTADDVLTLNLINSSGYQSLTNQNSSAALTFSNIANTSVALNVVDQDSTSTTFGFKAAAVAGSNSATLTVSNAVSSAVTIAGVETLNIVSTGAPNSVTLTTAAATKYVTSGDTTLDLGTVPATVEEVNASASTAGVTLVQGGADLDVITGGSGNDSVTTGAYAAYVNVQGGAGNDTVKFVATGTLTSSDTVNGGDDIDTIEAPVAQIDTSAITTALTRVTNFETLAITDALSGTVVAANIQAGLETVKLKSGGTGTLNLEAGVRAVNVAAALTGGLTVNDTGSATTDSLTISNSATTAVNVFAGQATTIGGFETVNVSTNGVGAATTQTFGAVAVTGDAAATVALNFSGANALTIGQITADGVVSFAGVTAAASGLTVDQSSSAAVNVDSITGSEGNDKLKGDADDDTSLYGMGGRDSLIGGTGDDLLDGGAGNDTIEGSSGNDTVLGGAGNDLITFGANYTSGDSVDGGDNIDTLSITSATTSGTINVLNGLSLTAVNALNARISNVEKVKVTDALVVDGANFDFARLDGINQIELAANWTGAETIILSTGATVDLTYAGADGDDLTIEYGDATSTTDSLVINLKNDAATNFGDVTIADIETVTINTSEATATDTVESHVFDLTADADISLLTIAGTESLNLSGVAIVAETITASGLTGNLNVLGGSSDQTITGSNYASASTGDTIDGGAGADTIDGGAGNDSLVGGTGNDSIIAGAGVDAITGGAGNDSINLAETVAAVDTVLITTTGLDSISGFTAGTGGDVLAFDISSLESAYATLDFANLDDGASTGDSEGGFQELNGAETAAANTSFFVLQGSTFDSTSSVEDALETGGSYALTIHADVTTNDGFFVIYTNGTDAYVALAKVNADNGTTAFPAGELTITNVAKLVGIGAIAVDQFAAGNFDFVA